MPRLRICQLITELHPSGAERCLYELACRLDRRRFEVHVAALRGGAVAEWLGRAGVGVTVLGVRGKADALRLAGLVRLLRRKRIDLLHTHLFHADLAGRLAARIAGTPHLVHTVHVAEGRFRPWQFAWARLTAGWCDRVVCVSGAVLRHHARKAHLPPWRYQVIRNGIDPAPFAAQPQRRAHLRRQWSVAPDECVVVSVGRLDFQKNTRLLVSVADELLRRRTDVHFVIVGDGPERDVVEAFIDRSGSQGRARWLGFREDVPDILAAGDVFVQPSRWEGLPLTVAEAMAAGLPVVATDVSGNAEVVRHGETGILCESDDLEGLVRSIERLLDEGDTRVRFGAAGRRRAIEEFSVEANVASHERLYEQIASG